SPGPAGSDGRESCEPRLCRFGCGTPRRSVGRFADSASWDYAASFRRPHGRVLHSFLSGRASVGDSVRIASDTFACSWLCEGLAVSRASVQLRNEADELDAPRAPSSRRGYGPTRINWGIDAGSDSRPGAGASGEATPQLWSGRRQVRAGGSG